VEWYKRWFGEEYLLVYEHRDDSEAAREVEAMRDIIGLCCDDRVLDLCCGAGRHDAIIADMGTRVVGLDYSMPLLTIGAGARKPGCRYPLFVRGDARRPPFRSRAFDVVLNLFTSFGYFTDEENAGMLASMHRLLVPGGRFLIDYLNPPRVLATLVERSERTREGLKIVETRRYDAASRRVEKRIDIHDGDRERTYLESVRLYSREEMLDMLAAAGLVVRNVLGSMHGTPYSETSDRMILHGVRPEDA